MGGRERNASLYTVLAGVTVCPGIAISFGERGEKLFPEDTLFLGHGDAERFPSD